MNNVSSQALSGIVDRISISQMDEENELKRNASRHPVTVGLLFPKDEVRNGREGGREKGKGSRIMSIDLEICNGGMDSEKKV